MQAYLDESSEDLRQAVLAPHRTDALSGPRQSSERIARVVRARINQRNSMTFIAATEALGTAVLTIMLVVVAADVGGGDLGTGHCHVALGTFFSALDTLAPGQSSTPGMYSSAIRNTTARWAEVHQERARALPKFWNESVLKTRVAYFLPKFPPLVLILTNRIS